MGSDITYEIESSIPIGLKTYQYYIEDTLPNGQVYTGPSTLNGVTVMPVIEGNKINFITC